MVLPPSLVGADFSRLIDQPITLTMASFAGKKDKKGEKQGYQFKVVKEIPHTEVKDQNRSGTCWSYSTISLLESEILRNTGKEYYIVKIRGMNPAMIKAVIYTCQNPL